MYYSNVMAETVLEAEDYPMASLELTENSWTMSTYPVEGATRLGSHKLCDLCIEVISPDGERWTENRGPIYTETGASEAEAAIKTAKWVKAHWAEVMQSQC